MEFIKKNKYLVILIIIILLGTFLRFYKLGELSFNSDEFLDINSSYAYHQTGVWQSWDFNMNQANQTNVFAPRDERAWVYKWQAAKLFSYLPPSEAVARSISALWGVLTIILMYFATRYYTKNKAIALIAAFLFSVSLSGLTFDRKLRMYAMFFPMFLVFSWSVYLFLEQKYKGKQEFIKKIQNKFDVNLLYLIPAVVLGLISMLVHELTVNIVFILFAYCLLRAMQKYKKYGFYWNKYSIVVIAMILGVLGAKIIFPDIFEKYAGALKFFNKHYSYVDKIFFDYAHALLAFFALVYGAYYMYKNLELRKQTLWLAVSFFVPLLSAIFLWKRNVGSQYIFFIQSFEIMLIAVGIYGGAMFVRSNVLNQKFKFFVGTIVFLLLLLPNYYCFFQKDNFYNQTSNSDEPRYRQIFQYFNKKRGENDVLITRDFRNYYISGQKVKVFDFGGEMSDDKLSLEDLQKIEIENPTGWLIYSDNDETYITKEAQQYANENYAKINDIAVRGNVSVYHWGVDMQQ